MGFWGFDSEPDRILANEMARDFSWTGEDNFEIVLDPFNDDRNGYLFVTNPNGALSDALIADNGDSVNRDWDGVWEVRTQVTEEGWFAEVRIPFSTRRLSGSVEVSWGEFYLGEQQNIGASARWRVSKHLTFRGDYERNRITLFGGEFLVDEVGARADFAFTPDLFGAVAGQWNNEDEEVILNFRLNWIPRPGSDLFLVINQQAETWESRWNPTQTTVLTKLV